VTWSPNKPWFWFEAYLVHDWWRHGEVCLSELLPCLLGLLCCELLLLLVVLVVGVLVLVVVAAGLARPAAAQTAQWQALPRRGGAVW
jgi:hypothetical protein